MNEIIVIDTNIIVLVFNLRESANSANARAERFTIRFAEIHHRRAFQTRPENSKATKLSADEVFDLLSSIINRIKFYDEDLISIGSWIEAVRLCRETDEKDAPYIALSLELNAKIWTNDNQLKIGLNKKDFNMFYQP